MVDPQENPRPFSDCRCWSLSSLSPPVRCSRVISSREGEPVPMPYCEGHLEKGDPAVRVASHHLAGKCLVAAIDLPKNYKLLFHGMRGKCQTSEKEDRAISYYPPQRSTGRNHDGDGRIVNYNGVLNPAATGDVIQFAACPGPGEYSNMKSTFEYFGVRNGRRGGLKFVTTEVVPKGTQLVHWYGPGWWSARGVKRLDVGTENMPVPKRSDRGNDKRRGHRPAPRNVTMGKENKKGVVSRTKTNAKTKTKAKPNKNTKMQMKMEGIQRAMATR